MRTLQPPGWPRPRGYANGIAASGTMVFVAGQIGWTAEGQFESEDLVVQVEQALRNVVAVLRTGGAGPEHLTRMTWYVVDRGEYRRRAQEIGAAYRSVIGAIYPAMSLIEVKGLLEDRAMVEIECTAVVPDPG